MQTIKLTDDGPARFVSGPTGTLETGDTAEVNASAAEFLLDKPFIVTAADSFNAEEWLEPDYEERLERVESGEHDDYLEEIVEAETSQTVADAAEERLEE